VKEEWALIVPGEINVTVGSIAHRGRGYEEGRNILLSEPFVAVTSSGEYI